MKTIALLKLFMIITIYGFAQPNNPQTVVFPVTTICPSQTLILDVGDCGYESVEWTNATGSILGYSSILDVTGLPSDTYTARVTYGLAFSYFKEYEVIVTGGLDLTNVSSTPACAAGGTATVIPNGGVAPYQFSWNDSKAQTTAIAIDLAVGTYNVTVTDARGCPSSTDVIVEASDYCTQMWVASCGQTYHNINSGAYLHPEVSGAEGYKWTFLSSQGVPSQHITTGRIINFIDLIPALEYNETYTVSIQVIYNNGIEGPAGPSCTITIGDPQTQMWVASCGQTYHNINTGTYLHPEVHGAESYKWTFLSSQGVPSQHITTGRIINFIDLIPALEYNETYTVSIQVIYNNGIEASAGPSCTITIGDPQTQMWVASCGQTYHNINTGTYLHPEVYGAEGYKWTFLSSQGVPSQHTTTGRIINFIDLIPAIEYNETYTVSIQVIYNNGVEASAGSSCTITMGDPQTQMWVANCGKTYNDINTGAYLHPEVHGAEGYKWTFLSSQGIPSQHTTTGRIINFIDLIPAIEYNETYKVSIQVIYNNGVEASAGPSCTITMGSNLNLPRRGGNRINAPNSEQGTGFNAVDGSKHYLEVFPNPNRGNFMLDLTKYKGNVMTITIKDYLGRQVLHLPSRKIEDTFFEINLSDTNLNPGVYFLVLNVKNQQEVKQFVIAK